MKKDKIKNITVKELLSVIPDDKISTLAASTHVDYCTKVSIWSFRFLYDTLFSFGIRSYKSAYNAGYLQ